MNKKEIYEHLANIYLDASSKSSKKKRRLKSYPKSVQNLIIVGAVLVLGLGSTIAYSSFSNHNRQGQIALFLYQDTAKINFNFDPAKKEIYSINLNKLSIARFKNLGFAVRKANYGDTISLRVEFINSFKEKSEVYIRNIPYHWQNYKIPLAQFKGINDWTEMSSLMFIVEEWNTKENHGVVYIDNVGLLN